MWALVLVLGAGVTATDDIPARVEVLQRHLEALAAIQVLPEHQPEKEARLGELLKRLGGSVASGEDVNALYRAMDGVRTWLWDHAAPRPERAPGEFVETPEAWRVRTPRITLSLARADLAMTIETPGATWRHLPSDATDLAHGGHSVSLLSAASKEATPFHTGYSAGMRLRLADFEHAPSFALILTYYVMGDEVIIDVAAEEAGPDFEHLDWPKALQVPAGEEATSVCPLMQGILIPGNWPQDIYYGSLAQSREFYMPWWGHIVDGHGVLAIIETSDDAGGFCHHAAGGPTRLGPRWYASQGRFGRLRSIRYAFQENATHVTLAKRYRRHVLESGRFVSLREKALRNPALESVIGSPVIHLGALYHYVPEAGLYNHDREELNHQLRTFDQLAASLRKLREQGLERAYVHLDGWGFHGYDSAHPDPLPVGHEQGGWAGLRRFADTCRDLGYFFAVHDQYRDLYFNAVSFDDRITVTDRQGARFEVSQWCGGPQTVLSPRFAPEYVRRNHDLFAENGVDVRGAYLDVFSPLPFDESAQEGTPVTRGECAAYRRACYALLRARGYVVSSEEPTDYLVDAIDLVHHAPHAIQPFPQVWSGQAAVGIPVPLFSLVYHDALLVPWDLRDDDAWGVPRGMSGRLLCLLHAGLPYAAPPYGAGEPQPFPKDHVDEAARLARHCAFLEMTGHEFLNPERTRQRSTFADGTRVTVDFGTGETEVLLAGDSG